MGTVLLSTTYFGPVQWYQKLHRAEYVQVEQWESFQKQTYRNRCLIATTQGIQALTVPTERGGSPLIKDTRISDHGNWRHLHWNALQSAYGESPFFEYYQDDIRPFFEQRWDYLLDFNEAIRTKICELIDIQPKVTLTKEFTVYSLQFTDDYSAAIEGLASISTVNCKPSTVNNTFDFRSAIRPKNPLPDPDFEPKSYYQVYQQKHGFLPNLSILDLLFNMGPESIFYL
ncbi:MAG: WbqC family protein [Prevotella sp.]|nr:WbqC family protein [Prevotella sp.]